jgi:hypothetical protein
MASCSLVSRPLAASHHRLLQSRLMISFSIASGHPAASHCGLLQPHIAALQHRLTVSCSLTSLLLKPRIIASCNFSSRPPSPRITASCSLASTASCSLASRLPAASPHGLLQPRIMVSVLSHHGFCSITSRTPAVSHPNLLQARISASCSLVSWPPASVVAWEAMCHTYLTSGISYSLPSTHKNSIFQGL